MTGPTTIWICAAHDAAYRNGGWAQVRLAHGLVSGSAGGERGATARRMALAGLAAALRDLPSDRSSGEAGPIRVHTASPELMSLAVTLAGRGPPVADPGADPDPDLDLLTRILAAGGGRRLELIRARLQPDSPIAFAAAWADLARDKAKATGAFVAAIPKPNLAKVSGLDAG